MQSWAARFRRSRTPILEASMLTLPLLHALTFDDVLLVPGPSEVHPNQVDLSTRLTQNIVLRIPLLSAAMDTVTEGRLAIALAQQGGIGIIHKNLSIDRQTEEVDKVKRSESGMITDPHRDRSGRPDPGRRSPHGQVQDLGGARRPEPQAGRHPHEPGPALRDQHGPPRQRAHDEGEPGHRARGHDPPGGQGHPPAPPHREAAGGGRGRGPAGA